VTTLETTTQARHLGPTGAQFVPLHYYFVKAMDSMYAHLTTGAALPPSQVMRPTPRGMEAYTPANVPGRLPLPSLAPAAGNRIVFKNRALSIPEKTRPADSDGGTTGVRRGSDRDTAAARAGCRRAPAVPRADTDPRNRRLDGVDR
jgi:hypothetical protein